MDLRHFDWSPDYFFCIHFFFSSTSRCPRCLIKTSIMILVINILVAEHARRAHYREGFIRLKEQQQQYPRILSRRPQSVHHQSRSVIISSVSFFFFFFPFCPSRGA